MCSIHIYIRITNLFHMWTYTCTCNAYMIYIYVERERDIVMFCVYSNIFSLAFLCAPRTRTSRPRSNYYTKPRQILQSLDRLYKAPQTVYKDIKYYIFLKNRCTTNRRTLHLTNAFWTSYPFRIQHVYFLAQHIVKNEKVNLSEFVKKCSLVRLPTAWHCSTNGLQSHVLPTPPRAPRGPCFPGLEPHATRLTK